MRGPAALILVAFLAPLLPMAEAAEGSPVWSVDARLSPVSLAKVTEERTITYDGRYYSPSWTVTVPPGGTFREARDKAGPLSATVTGDKVKVSTHGNGVASYAFTVTFDLKPRAEHPFLSFNATVPAGADSPTSIALDLPPGWSLEGWFGSTGTAPDAGGTFRRTGGQAVEFLVLPAGQPDAAPAAPVEGRRVLREGVATLTPAGGRLNVTITYDTDVYGRAWQLPLPEDATLVLASSPYGPLPATVAGGMVSLQTPYKAGYHLGARSFSVEVALGPHGAFGGPYRQANLSIAAAEEDDVRLRVALAPDLTHVGDTVSGGARVAPLRYEASGPMRARVAFLPPAPADAVRFATGAYVVQAPAGLEGPARATAERASALLPEALPALGGAEIGRPFFVAYTDEDVFGWEEGFYSHGLDAISIRASELRDAPDDGKAHLVPVSTLVHETAHGLLDRRFRDSPDDLSFLHEGLARLAETRVEPGFAAEAVTCTTTGNRQQCVRQSARPDPERLQAFLRADVFDATWGADAAAADARAFLYDYSGLVFHAYERTAGSEALRHAVAEMAAHGFTDDPAQDAEKVVDVLLAWAPGMTREQLLYPGRQVAHLPAGQFRACMGDLLPPPFPFETREAEPAGGCGWPTVGTRDPPPPTPTPPPPSPTPPGPSPTTPATPAPTDATPSGATPAVPSAAPTTGATPAPDADDAPLDVDRTSSPMPREPTSRGVPGPTLALGLAALAAVAVLARPRR